MDELVKEVVKHAADEALHRLLERLCRMTAQGRIDAAMAEMIQDAVFETEGAFKAFVSRQSQINERVTDELTAKLDEQGATAIFMRLFWEVVYAATKDRRTMLAHALAGIFHPDLEQEMKSRVSRAVIMLEPSDVMLLREMRAAAGGRGNVSTVFRAGSQISQVALAQAGCIDSQSGYGGTWTNVAGVGNAVAIALAAWDPPPPQSD